MLMLNCDKEAKSDKKKLGKGEGGTLKPKTVSSLVSKF